MKKNRNIFQNSETEKFSPDFLITPMVVIKDKSLQPIDHDVFGVVYWFEKMKDGRCIAANTTIADVLGCNAGSVANSLVRLEAAGHIKRIFKDQKKKNRSQIKCLISFGKVASDEARVSSINERVSSDDETRVSSIDEQSKNYNIHNTNTDSATDEKTLNKNIGEVIKAFEEINPMAKQFYQRKPEREACRRLIEMWGFDGVIGVIQNVLPKTNKEKYAPTITSPFELEAKAAKLKVWIDKERSGQKSKVKIGIA